MFAVFCHDGSWLLIVVVVQCPIAHWPLFLLAVAVAIIIIIVIIVIVIVRYWPLYLLAHTHAGAAAVKLYNAIEPTDKTRARAPIPIPIPASCAYAHAPCAHVLCCIWHSAARGTRQHVSWHVHLTHTRLECACFASG
jgi:hypothetical protein